MDYRETVRSFGRPTDDQLVAFADRVSTAHSWYKKLPIDDPGEAFFVFPSPYTHMALIEDRTGAKVPRPFTTSWDERGLPRVRIAFEEGDVEPSFPPPLGYITGGISTVSYRERFGIMTYWNYSRPGEPPDEALDSACRGIRWYSPESGELPVPEEVLEAGRVYLTAAVHPVFEADEDRWGRCRSDNAGRKRGRCRKDQLDALVDAQQQVRAILFDR